MSDESTCRSERNDSRRRAADEPSPRPPATCAMVLSMLNRDHILRRTYLRRRWQGLLE